MPELKATMYGTMSAVRVVVYDGADNARWRVIKADFETLEKAKEAEESLKLLWLAKYGDTN